MLKQRRGMADRELVQVGSREMLGPTLILTKMEIQLQRLPAQTAQTAPRLLGQQANPFPSQQFH
jgi:hypothetical protein